ncbi:MAG TPA: DUF1328 domain-containing protein [Anaerolineae bacterium]|jgi:uncharacterized membrane protein YhaH (DUF805 family)|nr:DUF1328 domain-containing protein [Anaerolineae bacterium]
MARMRRTTYWAFVYAFWLIVIILGLLGAIGVVPIPGLVMSLLFTIFLTLFALLLTHWVGLT